ncbi:MAG: penicillin-binding transpeptidase domain-containing protein [Myxococcota bacterium]
MSVWLALAAGAVYASALLFARNGSPASRRAVWATAAVMVLALPLGSLAPRWPAPAAASNGVLGAVGALQEPASGAVPALSASAPWLGSALLVGWALGAALALARVAADLVAVHQLRASAVDHRGDVAYTAAIDVPMAVGVARPVVLLPLAARGWTAERLALVLAHERAHTSGHDNLWLLIARLAAAVHWFDPLGWWAVAELRDACEHRADDLTLAGGADRDTYARTLVELARRAPAAAFAMARPSRLEQRVRAVLGERPRTGALGVAVRAAAVATLAVGVATAAPSASRVPTGLAERLEREADRLMTLHHPEGVALLVLDARTGAIVGRADRGGITDRPMPPGSVVKPFVVAAALEAGVPADQAFTDGTMASILERSSNTGAQAVAARVGRGAIEDLFHRVGLPVSDAPLDALALGSAPATPVQVAAAWTHLAGHGAIPAAAAAQTREWLVGAVEGPNATGGRAAVPGVRVAGKTGTAPLANDEVSASFVGLVPADDPDFVVLVTVAGPDGDERWGGVVAAPAFRRIVDGW